VWNAHIENGGTRVRNANIGGLGFFLRVPL